MKLKNLFPLVALIIISTAFVACKEEEGKKEKAVIKMTVTSLKTAELQISGSEEITLNWGDNTDTVTFKFSSDTLIKFRHDYTLDKSYNITIKGDVKTLNCNYNNIENLDVSKCPVLRILNCGNNNLSSLDLTKCITLTALDCSDNLFSATALNDLFGTLPASNYVKTVEIFSNYGCESCDRSIAEKKGWHVGDCW
jgi:hypothetical protein